MPRFGYSARIDEPCAKAFGKEMRISPKDAVEVCRSIKGMKLTEAKKFLSEVIERRRPVRFTLHRKKVPHRKGVGSGAYPVKAAEEILKLLENAEANAVYRGLDPEKLKVVHASAYKGITIPGILPRAFGRASRYDKPLTNAELVLKEET
ncbi:MAG: 50S ribosomal protein L22 [Candidatus Hadarchaeales archaeon]